MESSASGTVFELCLLRSVGDVLRDLRQEVKRVEYLVIPGYTLHYGLVAGFREGLDLPLSATLPS